MDLAKIFVGILTSFRDMPPEEARKDFLERLKNYERAYEALDDEKDADLPYIKVRLTQS